MKKHVNGKFRLMGLVFILLSLFISIPKTVISAQTNWQLVWSDEFNGTAIDSSNWGYEIGYKRNNEQQYYTNRSQNARVENGNLVIQALRENYQGYAYTSASLTSQNKRSFQYGRWEMRARIPTPSGSWPAWWGMGINVSSAGWPKSGEIDMMEYYRMMALFNVMYANASNTPVWSSITKTVTSSFGDSYHIWAMEWDTSQIRLYLDGSLMNTFSVNNATVGSYNPFRQPYFMMLNLAIGGNNGGSPSATTFPLTYYVDYVRVYQAGSGSGGTPVSVNDNTKGTGQNQFNYSGTWSYGSQSGAYQSDNHWNSTTNNAYQVAFTGTKVQIYAAKNTNHGIFAVSIDGGAESNVDLYQSTRADQVLVWTSPTLSKASHTVKVRVTGTKNASSSGTAIVADRVDVTP